MQAQHCGVEYIFFIIVLKMLILMKELSQFLWNLGMWVCQNQFSFLTLRLHSFKPKCVLKLKHYLNGNISCSIVRRSAPFSSGRLINARVFVRRPTKIPCCNQVAAFVRQLFFHANDFSTNSRSPFVLSPGK